MAISMPERMHFSGTLLLEEIRNRIRQHTYMSKSKSLHLLCQQSAMYSRIPRLVNFMLEWRVEQETVDDTVRGCKDNHDDNLGEM